MPKGRPLPRRLQCTPNYISPSVRKAAPVLHPFFRCPAGSSRRNGGWGAGTSPRLNHQLRRKRYHMEEIWKKIDGFQGKYFVSNLGRVKNKAGRIISQRVQTRRHNYVEVELWENAVRHRYKLHRLVAKAFVENPYQYPEVNHKDENPLNNRADNLEWCDHLYNCRYGTRGVRIGARLSRPVAQLKNGTIVAVWDSIRDAGKAGYTRPSITKCCNGEYSHHKGYQWKFL